MRVVIERETFERQRVFGRMQRVAVWKRAWSAELLYADAKFILTRSAGAHQTFRGVPTETILRRHPNTGRGGDHFSYRPDHIDVQRLKLRPNRWGHLEIGRIRLSPASLRALRETMTACEVSFLGRDPVERRKRGYKPAAESGKKEVCKPSRTPRRRG